MLLGPFRALVLQATTNERANFDLVKEAPHFGTVKNMSQAGKENKKGLGILLQELEEALDWRWSDMDPRKVRYDHVLHDSSTHQ